MYLQNVTSRKTYLKKLVFFGVRGMDPRIRIRIQTKMSWIQNTARRSKRYKNVYKICIKVDKLTYGTDTSFPKLKVNPFLTGILLRFGLALKGVAAASTRRDWRLDAASGVETAVASSGRVRVSTHRDLLSPILKDTRQHLYRVLWYIYIILQDKKS
jgi:hypothetical protein